METRQGSLLSFQKVEKLLVANGHIRSNKITMIKWNDVGVL